MSAAATKVAEASGTEVAKSLERICKVPGWFGGNGSSPVFLGARDVFGNDNACDEQHEERKHRDGD